VVGVAVSDTVSEREEIMLTDMQLRALKPSEKLYKVADQQGLYVAVTKTGVISFRFDYGMMSSRNVGR
jgi:hypothetical protein